MTDFVFINHGVNHVSEIGIFDNQKEGYQHCQHGAGFTLRDAIENTLLYLFENEIDLEKLRSVFLDKYGPIEDTEEVECQTDSFYYVSIFYNRD